MATWQPETFHDTYSSPEQAGFNEEFAEYANALTAMLVGGRSPLTMGIFGGYGAGKTTLMKTMIAQLRQRCGVVVVEFNAWRHDHERHLFVPFLATLAAHPALRDDPTASEASMAAFRGFLAGLTFSLPGVSWSAQASLEKEAALNTTELKRLTSGFTDMEALLKKVAGTGDGPRARNIVVFVDDLDRCLPRKAFNLLESLRVFTDIPGFRFVIGLDPRAVAVYLRIKYPEGFCVEPAEYLQKMFQVPFILPRLGSDQVFEVCQGLLKTRENDWAKELLGHVEKLKKYLPDTVRQLKRILNMYQVVSQINPLMSKELLLRLLIVQTRWPKAYYELHKNPQWYLDQMKDKFERQGSKKSATPTLEGFCAEFLCGCNVIDCINCLARLGWPTEVAAGRRRLSGQGGDGHQTGEI